jgi:probable HAF family extracellular repeat protein
MGKNGVRIIFMLFVLAIVPMWSGSANADWTIADLGTLATGTRSQANSINDAGQVVGYSTTSGTSASHAFLWSNGTLHDIETSGYTNSYAQGINSSGTVVGYTTPGNTALMWSNGAEQVLTGLTQATSINNSGMVAGYNASHALLWNSGTVQDLGTLGGATSQAYGINDAGQVVGSARNAKSDAHAFLWSNGTMQDLGTLGGVNSTAYSINEAGQVVGYAQKGTAYHAFLWSNGTMQDLGTLGGTISYAFGINDAGQVVGYAQTAAGASHAALWSEGSVTDLNTLIDGTGWTLTRATAINGAGQIVGYGTISGQTHAFLLTPDAAPVPIPGAVWLLGTGLFGLVGIKRRFKR